MPPPLKDNFTTYFIGHQASIGAGQAVTGNRKSLRLPDLPGRMMFYRGWKDDEVQMPLISDDDIISAVRAAQEQYGDLEQYQLHYNEDDLAAAPQTEHEIILEAALNDFAGNLKARPIYDHLRPMFSRNRVFALVAEIVERGEVYFGGQTYVPVKQSGNYYKLEILESQTVSGQESQDMTHGKEGN